MRSLAALLPCLAPLSMALVACSGSAANDLVGADASSDAANHDEGSATSGDGATSGPVVRILIDAVQTPEGSGPSQETPVDQRVGVYGLTLLRSETDPSPLVVLHHAAPVDVQYDTGSSTVIGTVSASKLTSGTYTVARVPVAYVSFTVAGTAHTGGLAVPGDFKDLIALTSGVTLDGATRSRGWYSTSFLVGGATEASTTGMDSAIAQPGASSGLALDLTQPIAAYVFPIQLTIPASITEDMEVVFTANTYQDFHWQDESETGYKAGVFDVSATAFEPVTQLGANSCTVTFEPTP